MTNKGERIHCCDAMAAHVASGDVPLTYLPRFREYGLKISDGGTAKQLIEYCPWCGRRLPESLRNAWFEQLEKLGLNPEDPRVPDRMKTDAWWRTSAPLREVLSEHMPEIRQKFGVQSLAIFGSVARNEASAGSDVDVLVDFEGRPTFDHYMGLKLYLEELFGVAVDLAIPSDLRPALRPRIEEEALRVS
jgi:predicted nucleotidyltransferase